jgi:polysaccharide pyruvyl transferase WcaK-like protein
MLKQAADAAKRPISIRVIESGGPAGGPLWYPPDGIAVDDEVLMDWYDHVLPDTQLWRAVAECDVVLDVGNGDLFSDIYGADYFFLVTCYRIAALAQRIPLVLSPQTVGPFRNSELKSVAAQLCMRCKKVFTRDTDSLLLLDEMGVAGVEQCVDLAFRLPFTSPRSVPSRTIRFGLNVSGLLYDDASTKRFAFGLKADYPRLVKAIISTIKRRPDVSLVLVPHVVGDAEIHDTPICRKLSEEFNLPLAPQFKSPIEAKSFIAGLDVLAASRMHATIAAVSSGVPVIPLAYSRKFSGVLRSVNYPLVCDLASEDVESVVAHVEHALTRLSELRAAASNSIDIARTKLDRYQSYLNEHQSAGERRGRSLASSLASATLIFSGKSMVAAFSKSRISPAISSRSIARSLTLVAANALERNNGHLRRFGCRWRAHCDLLLVASTAKVGAIGPEPIAQYPRTYPRTSCFSERSLSTLFRCTLSGSANPRWTKS